jgi:hypothetical protein
MPDVVAQSWFGPAIAAAVGAAVAGVFNIVVAIVKHRLDNKRPVLAGTGAQTLKAESPEEKTRRRARVRKSVANAALIGLVLGVVGWNTYVANTYVEGVNATVNSLVAQDLARESKNVVGTVAAWPSAVPVPEGWHVCAKDQHVPFNESLWRVLRGLYGNPDAEVVKEIKLPDLSDRFLRGAGTLSEPIGQPQEDALQDHQHESSILVHIHSGGDAQHPAADGKVTGARTAVETRPKNYAVEWIIRVK